LGLPLSVTRLKRGELQHLENKIVGKNSSGIRKYLNIAKRKVFIRAVFTSQTIYHIPSIDLPKDVNEESLLLYLHICGRDLISSLVENGRLIGNRYATPQNLEPRLWMDMVSMG
jgi:hypothetical protein